MEITTIGLDLAKHVFQVHAIAADGTVVLKKRLRRGQVYSFFAALKPCLVGVEACATAHFWARQLRQLGHDVRLMPAQYVKAYLKRGKNDAADAAAICEAVTRPSMRFVPIKGEDQQAALMLHRARDLLVRQRTQLINAIRGHLAEFGVIEAQGPWNVPRLLAGMEEAAPGQPARGGGAAHRRDRHPDHGLAQGQPRVPAACGRAGHRSARRHRDCGHAAGPDGVS